MARTGPLDKAFELRNVGRSADDTHAYVHDQGFLCHRCNHRHGGAPLRFICIGCACDRRAPTLQDFEFARLVEWSAELEYVPGGVLEPQLPARDGEVH